MTSMLAALAGMLMLAWLVCQGGVDEVGRRLAGLGPVLPLALVPYTLASLCDALGWRVVLRAFDVTVPFTRLWLVRLAGEAVNSVAPTGLGGEPLKALLLRTDGAPGPAVTAAVLVSRTGVTVTQALLVVIGVGALLRRLGWTVAAPIAVAGLLVLTAAFGLALVRVQERGLTGVLARALAWLVPSERFAGRVHGIATAVDTRLAIVYGRERPMLLAATAWHMLAWLATSAEVWLVLRLLEAPVSCTDALIIEGLAQPIRATGILVPGAVGTQEAGGVAVCRWLGISQPVGVTLWLVRRGREVVFDAVGLLYLAARNARRVAGKSPGVATATQATAIRPSPTAGP